MPYVPPHASLAVHDPKKVNGGWEVFGNMIPKCDSLTAYLYAFRHAPSVHAKEHLFWRVADMIWNQDPNEEKFQYHRWSRLMIHKCCTEKYVAIGGAGNSGKSYVMAGWALVNWWADPKNTLILITSTTLKGAQGRIWGDLINLGRSIEDSPWKIRESIGEIVYCCPKTGRTDSKSGIRLIAADKSQSRDKVGKMIGLKQRRVILVADELSDIAENVITAAVSNLAKNHNPKAGMSFQMIGMSNPSSRFDPFGIFATPAGGWDSVLVEHDKEWRTALGGCFIRLDGEDSPNFDGGVYYPYLPDAEKNETAKLENSGDKSRGYMRMNRAIFFDSDESETVYTEAEITRAGAMRQGIIRNAERIAGVDLSWTIGGDKTIFTLCEIGYDEFGQHAIHLLDQIEVVVDATNKADPPTLQVCDKIKALCEKHGVKPENLAIDCTGGGGPVGDMLSLQFSPEFLRVDFGGQASKKRISMHSKALGCEKYANRVSELWFIGKNFLMGRQFYGLTPELCRQMGSRNFFYKAGKLQVEPKGEYKARMKRSPDHADSLFVTLELARQRHFFMSADPVPERAEGDTTAAWQQKPHRTIRSFDVMSRTPNAFLMKC